MKVEGVTVEGFKPPKMLSSKDIWKESYALIDKGVIAKSYSIAHTPQTRIVDGLKVDMQLAVTLGPMSAELGDSRDDVIEAIKILSEQPAVVALTNKKAKGGRRDSTAIIQFHCEADVKKFLSADINVLKALVADPDADPPFSMRRTKRPACGGLLC